MIITLDQLKRIMPTLPDQKADLYFPHLSAAMQEREINTALRCSAFLAQLAHESADLRYMEEIGAGHAYDVGELAIKLGNTPEDDGDGERYKGRGPIQLTGKANYKKYGDLLQVDLVLRPDLASLPEYGFRIAALFWTIKKLNALADMGFDGFKELTRRINGGYNGLEDRLRRYEIARRVLDDTNPLPLELNKCH